MTHLPLVYRELNEFLVLKAKKELNEDENAALCLEKLKKLIIDENFYCCTEDEFLVMFLRNKKYDVKGSFQQLKNYSKHRRLEGKHFVSNEFVTMQKVLDSKVCGLLPKRDPEGRVILFFRASQYTPGDYSPDDVMRTVQALSHFVLGFPATQVSGLCFIADATINSFEVFQLLFKYLRVFVPKLHFFPARFKRVDCINTNLMFRACFHLVRPLIPSKLLRRVTLLGDEKDALLKVYPADILPKEFGGDLGSFDHLQDTWILEFEKFMPTFIATSIFYEKEIKSDS